MLLAYARCQPTKIRWRAPPTSPIHAPSVAAHPPLFRLRAPLVPLRPPAFPAAAASASIRASPCRFSRSRAARSSDDAGPVANAWRTNFAPSSRKRSNACRSAPSLPAGGCWGCTPRIIGGGGTSAQMRAPGAGAACRRTARQRTQTRTMMGLGTGWGRWWVSCDERRASQRVGKRKGGRAGGRVNGTAGSAKTS